MTREIPLTKNRVALVDDEDFEELSQFKWRLGDNRKYPHKVYAIRKGRKGEGKKTISMHRVIAGAPDGAEVDHIDGDGLNNTKSNLRIVTRQDNAKNRRLSTNNYSGYTGVYMDKRSGRWKATLRVNKKFIWLGSHSTIQEAAMAYQIAADEHFGQFRRNERTS